MQVKFPPVRDWTGLYSEEKIRKPIFLTLLMLSFRGGSRTAATSKTERFVIIINELIAVDYYHKGLHLGCCSSPRSACAFDLASDTTTVSNLMN